MPELIDTKAALAKALPALESHRALALDTESNSFHAYTTRVCLLQLSVPGCDLLIDPLAGLDLAPLGRLLNDAGREVILHAAENDVIALQHEFGWRIPGLFDTQVAAFVLGLKPYSLAGILEARFGVKLDKSEQRSDWARRPLTDKQIRYAADDTHYLLELAKELRQRAEESGRIEEIEWECRRIAEREWQPEPFDPEGFRKMSGARDLDGVGLRILRDLYLMRNEEAERRDRAPFRVVGDSVLVDIARRRSAKGEKPQSFWKRYGARVRGIVEGAADRAPVPARRPRNPRGAPTPPDVKAAYERLRRWRSRAAEERGVEPFVVARNELLSKIANARCESPEQLKALVPGFTFTEYGEAILAVLHDSPNNA